MGRYMDWLLTVPLLLIEIILVMKLTPEESSSKCWTLGVVSALMIISGYKGELIIEGNLDTRWQFWTLSMIPFLYIVYTLLVGLADATNRETDDSIKALIQRVQLVTVISWCTYPVVYVFPMTDGQFQLVYNVLSFSLASMMACTLFLWMRAPAVSTKYQPAVVISGLVTFIAAYHYMRIFNSWVSSYAYGEKNIGGHGDPVLTGVPFNDAYRYMDWLLTVPLLLIEIILVMKLTPEESSSKCLT